MNRRKWGVTGIICIYYSFDCQMVSSGRCHQYYGDVGGACQMRQYRARMNVLDIFSHDT